MLSEKYDRIACITILHARDITHFERGGGGTMEMDEIGAGVTLKNFFSSIFQAFIFSNY